MADLYNDYRSAVFNGTAPDFLTDTMVVALLASTYVFSEADNLSTVLASAVGTPQTLVSKLVTANGEFSADDVTFPTTSGAEVDAVLLYQFDGGSGVPVAYIDLTAPITPDGRDILLEWDALGIIRL